jgi:hypothetical protein
MVAIMLFESSHESRVFAIFVLSLGRVRVGANFIAIISSSSDGGGLFLESKGVLWCQSLFDELRLATCNGLTQQ